MAESTAQFSVPFPLGEVPPFRSNQDFNVARPAGLLSQESNKSDSEWSRPGLHDTCSEGDEGVCETPPLSGAEDVEDNTTPAEDGISDISKSLTNKKQLNAPVFGAAEMAERARESPRANTRADTSKILHFAARTPTFGVLLRDLKPHNMFIPSHRMLKAGKSLSPLKNSSLRQTPLRGQPLTDLFVVSANTARILRASGVGDLHPLDRVLDAEATRRLLLLQDVESWMKNAVRRWENLQRAAMRDLEALINARLSLLRGSDSRAIDGRALRHELPESIHQSTQERRRRAKDIKREIMQAREDANKERSVRWAQQRKNLQKRREGTPKLHPLPFRSTTWLQSLPLMGNYPDCPGPDDQDTVSIPTASPIDTTSKLEP
jgi:hypothetical protein